jgi:hypothetical protein
MLSKRMLAATLALSAAAVALAGCGQSVGQHVVAAKLLSSANSSAAHTSFAASFELQAKLGLTGVSGLPSSELEQLQKLQTKLNSADLSGAVEYQDSSQLEGKLSLNPLLSQPVSFIYVSGVEYVDYDSGGWQQVEPVRGASIAIAPSPAAVPSWALGLGTLAKQETKVTDLGQTTIEGSSVDHLRAVVSGAGLAKIFQATLTDLPSSKVSSAEASELAGLIQFGQAEADSYLLTSSGLPMQESASGQLSLNLAALSLLDPGQPAVTGTVTLSFTGKVDFSRYGASFGITAPANVASGPAKLPSGLSQLF